MQEQNQNFCGTTVTLGGNPAVIGQAHGALHREAILMALPMTAFSNTVLVNSDFTGTAGKTYILRWTITNGVCTASIDDVQIRLDQAPTTSVSGGNQTICGTRANLNGTLPVIGTGQWSFAPGGNPGWTWCDQRRQFKDEFIHREQQESELYIEMDDQQWDVSIELQRCNDQLSTNTDGIQCRCKSELLWYHGNAGSQTSSDRNRRMELCTGGKS